MYVVNKTLREAKALLKQRGWTTRELTNEHGEHCLLGAIGAAAVGQNELDQREYEVFKEPGPASQAVEVVARHLGWFEALGPYSQEAHEQVYGFNDSAESVDAVLELLDSVIAA